MPDKPDIEELARKIVSHHYGGAPFRVKAEGGGLNNHVATVQHRAGDFIVRIRPDDSDVGVFLKEKWATAKAREAGVPAPEILVAGCEAVPNAYMIARKSAGELASRFGDRLAIARELGCYAARIHSIETRGFGSTFDWAPEERLRRLNWRCFLDEELKPGAKLELLERERMITGATRRRIADVLEGADAGSASPGSASPKLTHGDLRVKNVLIEPGARISAILDWENCTSNITPHWEFALALHDLNIDEKQAFIEGYGLSSDAIAEIAPVVKALNIVNYADKVEDLVRRRDEHALAEHRLRLSGALDLTACEAREV